MHFVGLFHSVLDVASSTRHLCTFCCYTYVEHVDEFKLPGVLVTSCFSMDKYVDDDDL